jgi:hypothetical protein
MHFTFAAESVHERTLVSVFMCCMQTETDTHTQRERERRGTEAPLSMRTVSPAAILA